MWAGTSEREFRKDFLRMTFVIVLLLIGLNGPFRYVETYSSRAECIRAVVQWRTIKEAQVITECQVKPKMRKRGSYEIFKAAL